MVLKGGLQLRERVAGYEAVRVHERKEGSALTAEQLAKHDWVPQDLLSRDLQDLESTVCLANLTEHEDFGWRAAVGHEAEASARRPGMQAV